MLEGSGQRLDNVDRTYPALASGMLVLQKNDLTRMLAFILVLSALVINLVMKHLEQLTGIEQKLARIADILLRTRQGI